MASVTLEAVMAGSKVPPAKTIQSAWEQSAWLTLVPPTTEVTRPGQIPRGHGVSSKQGMPWVLTYAGVGTAVGEGEAFWEPGAVAQAVAERRLPTPCSTQASACSTGKAKAPQAARFTDDTESMSLTASGTAAEMTTPAVTPSARNVGALLEWRGPTVDVEITTGRGWESHSAE